MNDRGEMCLPRQETMNDFHDRRNCPSSSIREGTQAGGSVGDPGIHLQVRNRKGEASAALSAPRCLSFGLIGSYCCWLQCGVLPEA